MLFNIIGTFIALYEEGRKERKEGKEGRLE